MNKNDNFELDRFDNKILSVLRDYDSMTLVDVMRKTQNRENRPIFKKRLRELADIGLITFDETNFKNSGFIIKLVNKNDR